MTRLRAAGLAAVVVVCGLGARAVLPDGVGGPLGDALYATLVVLLVVLIRPTTTPPVAALVGLGCCTAIELFQLTGVPVEIAAHVPAARLVLGTTFWAPDLLRYTAGAALAYALLAILRRRRPIG